MTGKLVTYAAIVALSMGSIAAADAAGRSNLAQDRSENQITAQLNRQQAQFGGDSVETYEGIVESQSPGPQRTDMREQIAQPPEADDLSIIE